MNYKILNKLLKLLYYTIIGLIIILICKEICLLKTCLIILKLIIPLFIGFIIAWILNPLIKKLKMHRLAAIILVYSVIIIAIALIIYGIVPSFNNDFGYLKDLIKEQSTKINSLITKYKLNDVIKNNYNKMLNKSPEILIKSISSLISSLVTIFISLVISFCLLINFDTLHTRFLKIIPKKYRKDVSSVIKKISIELYKYVKGILLIASFVFIFDSLIFYFIGIKSPLLFGLICGITDLIPYIGPYIGGGIAVIVGFSQSKTVGLLILLTVFIVQLVENCILQPIVMCKVTKTSPIIIMISLLVFSYFFGIIGVVIGAPIVIITKILYKYFSNKYYLKIISEEEKVN